MVMRCRRHGFEDEAVPPGGRILNLQAINEEYVMENTRITPQLVMRRTHLRELPNVDVPEGYTLRSFEPGDEAGWE